MDHGGRSEQGLSAFSILRRRAYVSCLGYVGILIRARGDP